MRRPLTRGHSRLHKEQARNNHNGGQDVVDREPRQFAAHAPQWYMDTRDNNNAQGHLLSTTKVANWSQQRQQGGRDNKEVPQHEFRLVVWQHYVACYKTLELEGKQHLVDPVLPVVAGMRAAVRSKDKEEEEEEDDYLPPLDWS